MKASEIRSMSEVQVEQQLTELYEEWRNLRFQEAVGSMTDTARIGKIRKDIARILTVKHERVLDAEAQAVLGE